MHTVLPLYVLIDNSASMGARRREISEAILGILDDLAWDVLFADNARISIITFNDRPTILVPLTDLTSISTIPEISFGGLAQIGPLIGRLGRIVSSDQAYLRSRAVRVMRPIAVMLTDGFVDQSLVEFRSAIREFARRSRLRMFVLALPGTNVEAFSEIPDWSIARIQSAGALKDVFKFLSASMARSALVDESTRSSLDLPEIARMMDHPSVGDDLW